MKGKIRYHRYRGVILSIISIVLILLSLFYLLFTGGCSINGKDNKPGIKSVLFGKSAETIIKEQEGETLTFLPAIEIGHQEGKWDQETSIPIFRSSYENEAGKVIAESKEGQKLIAPGTGEGLLFEVRNTGNTDTSYELRFETLLKPKSLTLPLEFQVRKVIVNGAEVTDEWIDLSSLNELSFSGEQHPGDIDAYRFDWKWPFEGTENEEIRDLNDASLGEASSMQDIECTIRIVMSGEAEIPDAVIERDLSEREIRGRKGIWPYFLLLLAGLSIAWILFLIFRRRVYVTGILSDSKYRGLKIRFNRKETEICEDGRFVFVHVFTGKKTIRIIDRKDQVILQSELRIRRKKNQEVPILKDDTIYIASGKEKAIALEMFLNKTLLPEHMVSISKTHRIFTEDGVIEPKKQKNMTPNGLCIDEKDYIYVEAGR